MDLTVTKIILFILIIINGFIVHTRRLYPKEDPTPPRDYRPSKWLSNSALDIWYGNKTVVDVISREFTEIMNKITNRPGECGDN